MNEITLYGTVGASFWDEDYFTASQVREMLVGREGPLTVRINSGGGIATEGQAIYTALKDYPGEVEIVVDGVAASAASLIAMAGDKITMRLGSWMLIHDPAMLFGYGRGTADDHRELATFLDKLGDAYAQVYSARSGMDAEAAREVMRAETVYLGDEAVAAGFATEFEGNRAAATAAPFDYRIYAHAPQAARDASSDLVSPQDQMAVLAAIAGFPRQKGVQIMSDPKTPAADAPTAVIVPKADAPKVELKIEEPKAEMKADAPKAEKPTMTAVQASMLHEMATKLNVDGSVVTAAISSGATFEQSVAKLNESWVSASDDLPRHGRPTARILRDERETTREAMTEALHAQMSAKAEPTDRARAFMGLSIPEMAAQMSDFQGPLRTAGDRIRALEMASHSTSDFPAIFENAMNKTLLEQYQTQAPTYREISDRQDFSDFRAHPMVRPGDFPNLQPIAEGGEIQFGTFGESKESAQLASYAVGLTITRQMMVNDEMGAIQRVLSNYGSMVANFEEATFYAFLTSARLADGQVVFRTQRANLAGTGTAITVDSVGDGKAAVRKQTSLGGHKLTLNPTILVVGPDQELAAQKIVAAVSPTQATEVNPYAGRMSVVVTAHITGNEWYLFTPPATTGGAVFSHGFLNGATGPRVRTEEPFGRQGMSMTLEHDFGLGAIDYRGAWKNPGA